MGETEKADEDDAVKVNESKHTKDGNQKAKENKKEKREAITPEDKDTKATSRSDDKKPQNPATTPQSSGGETVQDIYRKQVQRIEELERDNKRLQAEALVAETRWKKTEEELEERREASIEMVDLRAKAKEAENLVCHLGSVALRQDVWKR